MSQTGMIDIGLIYTKQLEKGIDAMTKEIACLQEKIAIDDGTIQYLKSRIEHLEHENELFKTDIKILRKVLNQTSHKS